MRKQLLTICFVLLTCQSLIAGQLIKQGGERGQQYVKDDQSLAKSEWIIHDIDSDGKGEYLYFDSNGFMLKNTITPDGYNVDNKGRWIIDGVVQHVDIITEDTTVENKVINNIKPKDLSQISILPGGSKTDEFVDNGGNTNGIENDPNTLPPKAVDAIKIIRFLCNEDGEIIIPHSKKIIKLALQGLGYKEFIINRAISSSGVNWNKHALILAQYYQSKGYSERRLREILKDAGFKESEEIDYAMKHIDNSIEGKYLNPSDYINLSKEQKILKLKTELEIADDQIEQALIFIESANEVE